MSKLCFNLDDVIGEIDKIHLITMQHAAEISPLVTERTIGPDLEPWTDEIYDIRKQREVTKFVKLNQKEKETDNRNASITTTKKSTIDSIPIKMGDSPPTTASKLDYDAINTSVIFREAEQQRKQTIRKELFKIQERQLASQRRSLERERKQHQEEHAKWLEQRRRSDSQLLQEAAQQTAREVQQQEQQLEALRKLTQRQLQMVSFQGISQYQHKFRGKYEIVVKLLMSIDKQALLSCTEYNRQLKELIQQLEQLNAKLKAGDCGPAELQTAGNLCKSLDSLEQNVIVELENIIQREQKKADALKQQAEQEQIEAQKKEQEQKEQLQQQQVTTEQPKAAVESVVTPTNAASIIVDSAPVTPASQNAVPTAVVTSDVTSSPQYVSAERYQFYTQINNFYHEKVEHVKPLQTDEAMKKYRFACQKAINIPVNAISAVTPQHLQDKFEKLYSFITGKPIKTPDGQISVNDHPLGRDYCILLMAKKFVSQGDTAVSSNPKAAFPVASVIVALWKLVADFGHIFLAYTYKESPFLVPYFIPQKPGQPVEEYFKLLGYRVSPEGQLEQQGMYLARQAGIARLYAAVMITAGRQLDATIPHPYPIDHGWRWLANFVALDPLPDICATLIMEFLQVVGADMWQAYGKQFVKLLLHIQHQYYNKISCNTVEQNGPNTRLKLLLDKFLRAGEIPKAQGQLPVGFW